MESMQFARFDISTTAKEINYVTYKSNGLWHLLSATNETFDTMVK